MKYIWLLLISISLVLAGCSDQGSETDKQDSDSSQTEIAEQNQGSDSKSDSQPFDFTVTKNTARVMGSDAEEISISSSKMVWPASKEGTTPNVVLLGPADNWQAQLAGLNLVHHPSDGPMLVTEKDKISDAVVEELERLKPRGDENGTKVIAIGMDEKSVDELPDEYKAESINGESPAELAGEVDKYYAKISGETPQGVVVSTSEQVEYAAPAGSWISHMPEPILYVKKDEIPEATKQALQKRDGNASIYLLGPESAISKKVEEELNEYGKTVRISGEDPVENAIAFAKYKDNDTDFGWGITSPGHGLIVAGKENLEESLAASVFAHRGKHSPLLITESEEAPRPLLDYMKEMKPLFKNSPTEGPYTHVYLVGGKDWVSTGQQGDLDHLVEIEAESGDSHGPSHDSGEEQQSEDSQENSENQDDQEEDGGHGGH